MSERMTETELKCLLPLLDKAIRCQQLIVFLPPKVANREHASLDSVVSVSQNGLAIQLNLQDVQ